MKFILVYNVLENKCFVPFLQESVTSHPDVSFLVLGDLLNVFPEFGEDIQSSILYRDIYGAEFARTLDKFAQNGYKYPTPESAELSALLKEALLPSGRNYEITKREQFRRYQELFSSWQGALSSSPQSQLIYLTNKMDSPDYCYVATRNCANIFSLDDKIIELPNGVKIGGIGGLPSGSQPFHLRTTIDQLANQFSPTEYQRKLKLMWGVDILVTHVSPEESPELTAFIKASPVSLVICGAPYKQVPSSNFKGSSELQDVGGKCIIHVSPFDATPKNPVYTSYIIDVLPNNLTSLLLPLDIYNWKSSPWTPEPSSRTKTEEELKGNLLKRTQTVILFKSPELPRRLNKIESDRKIGRERKKKLLAAGIDASTAPGDQSSGHPQAGVPSCIKEVHGSFEKEPRYEDGESSFMVSHSRETNGTTEKEKEKGKEKENEKEKEMETEKEKELEPEKSPHQEEHPPHNERYGVGGLGPFTRRGQTREEYMHKYEDGSWSPKIFIGVRKNANDV